MPVVLYSITEAVDWLSKHGIKMTDKGLRQAIIRGDLRNIRMGTVYVLTQDDLEYFIANPPRRGRPRKY
jgi:hypothetical protein